MSESEDLKIGDEVVTMLTGVVGDFRAKVIRYDTRYSATSKRPVLQVLTPDGKPHPRYKNFDMKDGDYIIQGRWGEVEPHFHGGE